MDKELVDKCKELNNEGYLISEISKKLNISKTNVYNSVSNRQNKIISQEEIALINKLRIEGLTIKEICEISGRSRTSIYNKLRNYNIKYECSDKKEHNIEPEIILKIKHLYNLGYSVSYISDLSNIPYYNIIYRLKKMGIYNNKYKKLTKNEINEILGLYKDGYSVLEISNRMDRTKNTIYRIIKNNGGLKL